MAIFSMEAGAAEAPTQLRFPRPVPDIVEKILNHRSGTIKGVAAIYNRHAYRDERRTALNRWAEAVMAADAKVATEREARATGVTAEAAAA